MFKKFIILLSFFFIYLIKSAQAPNDLPAAAPEFVRLTPEELNILDGIASYIKIRFDLKDREHFVNIILNNLQIIKLRKSIQDNLTNILQLQAIKDWQKEIEKFNKLNYEALKFLINRNNNDVRKNLIRNIIDTISAFELANNYEAMLRLVNYFPKAKK